MIHFDKPYPTLETPNSNTQLYNAPINNKPIIKNTTFELLLSAAQSEIHSILPNKQVCQRTSIPSSIIDTLSNEILNINKEVSPEIDKLTIYDIRIGIMLHDLRKKPLVWKKGSESQRSVKNRAPITIENVSPMNDPATSSLLLINQGTQNSSIIKPRSKLVNKTNPKPTTTSKNSQKTPPTLKNHARLIVDHIEKHPYDIHKDIGESLHLCARRIRRLIAQNNILYTSKQSYNVKSIRKSMFKKIQALNKKMPTLEISQIAEKLGYSYGMVKNALK